ncbi:MAG TPA: hypothetical protein VFU81_10740, partial [Thermomicrobiales bacterium]|nr:hypothetical protein [Thermomicrobiales bacterium]
MIEHGRRPAGVSQRLDNRFGVFGIHVPQYFERRIAAGRANRRGDSRGADRFERRRRQFDPFLRLAAGLVNRVRPPIG